MSLTSRQQNTADAVDAGIAVCKGLDFLNRLKGRRGRNGVLLYDILVTGRLDSGISVESLVDDAIRGLESEEAGDQ